MFAWLVRHRVSGNYMLKTDLSRCTVDEPSRRGMPQRRATRLRNALRTAPHDVISQPEGVHIVLAVSRATNLCSLNRTEL